MNGVSTIILLIGMIENVKWYVSFAFFWAGLFFFIVFVVLTIMKVIDIIYANSEEYERARARAIQNKEEPPVRGLAVMDSFMGYTTKALKWCAAVLIFTSFIGTVAIDKKYMIMIAASEVGEMVVKSEAMQSAAGEIGDLSKSTMGLLKKYIEVETLKIQDEINTEIEKYKPGKEVEKAVKT